MLVPTVGKAKRNLSINTVIELKLYVKTKNIDVKVIKQILKTCANSLPGSSPLKLMNYTK